MRWPTLVLSVTLFCSLSLVNAIPYDVDEKRHWLHKRQSTSTSSVPVIPPPSVTVEPSNSVVSPTTTPETPRTTSRPPPSPSSSTDRPPTSSTSQPPGTSSTVSSSSSSSSSTSQVFFLFSQDPTAHLIFRSTSSTSRATSLPPSTITSRPGTSPGNTSYRVFSSTRSLPSDTKSAGGNVQTGTATGNSLVYVADFYSNSN